MRELAATMYDNWVIAMGGATGHTPTWEELADVTKQAWRTVVELLRSPMPRIGLGELVRDNITGLTGIATAHVEYLHGCEQYYIEPRELKDGRPIEGKYIDEPRVEAVEVSAA